MLICIGSPRVIHAPHYISGTLMAYAHWFAGKSRLHFRVLIVLVFTLLAPKYLYHTLHETAQGGPSMIPERWSCTIRYTRVQYNIDVVKRTLKLQVRIAV